MKKIPALLLILAFPAACRAPGPAGAMRPGDVRTYGDFKKLFPVLKLPFTLGTETLDQPEKDSAVIPRRIISLFLPDTVSRGVFGKGVRPEWFALGQTHDKTLTYLILKAIRPGIRSGWLCLFDKKGNFLGSLLIGKTTLKQGNVSITTFLDRQFNITVSREQQVSPGRTILRQDVFGANPNGSFSLILVNSNQPVNPVKLYNPVAALPRKQRYSGDYTAGRMNLVSIRDAVKRGYFRFFIHFSKQHGNCTGEIDGTARWIRAGVGQYHEKTGPCAIRFLFRGYRVTLEETGGCGAYRGMGCLFSGSFIKKRIHVAHKTLLRQRRK